METTVIMDMETTTSIDTLNELLGQIPTSLTNPFHELVQHLLQVQSSNMLDMTKCSETSRNIYNFIGRHSQEQDKVMHHYDNLSNIESNLENLMDEIGKEGDKVFYVHFKHFVGENSHYFIIYQKSGNIYLLQSAVFEFSFRDWIYPDIRKKEIIESFRTKVEEIIDLYSDDDLYFASYINNEINNLKKNGAFVKQIENCKYSRGETIDIQHFVDELKKICGNWDTTNINNKMKIYEELFSCKLNPALIGNEIRLDNKNNALVKWVVQYLG